MVKQLATLAESPWFWGAFAGVVIVGVVWMAWKQEFNADAKRRKQLENHDRLQARSEQLQDRGAAITEAQEIMQQKSQALLERQEALVAKVEALVDRLAQKLGG